MIILKNKLLLLLFFIASIVLISGFFTLTPTYIENNGNVRHFEDNDMSFDMASSWTVYDYDNPLNDVEYNIEFIDTHVTDTYLIAAHSGVGQKAYFNDLANLNIDDDIYLELYDKNMHYKVIDITSTIKNGEVYINNSPGFLYLTTCDQTIKGYQLTIIASIIY